MQALQGQTVIHVKRDGKCLGDISYDVLNENGTPVLKGNGNISMIIRNRSYTLNSILPDDSGLQMKGTGGWLGWRTLTVRTKAGQTLGVIRNSFSFLGLRFLIENLDGLETYKVRQIGNSSFTENVFEILTTEDLFVGKLTQYYDLCSWYPKAYKLELVAPFDADSSMIFLATVFFLEDIMTGRVMRIILIFIIDLLILGILIAILLSSLD